MSELPPNADNMILAPLHPISADRRAAAADPKHSARRRRPNSLGAGLYA